MRAVVFVGPTLRVEEVRSRLDADCRPPAAQGDVYRAALDRPAAIGIIDGYFDGVPSVWHKEILWAMAEGIPVYGSASMGALRAAELDAFGMRGVGRIFEDYRDGRLEDDDEVAVLHAPAELSFQPLSEPMVSVRATLAKAVDARVLGTAGEAAIIEAAKAMHYRDRSWDRVLEAAAPGTGAEELAALRAWLPGGRLDRKREDALAMLEAMAAKMADPTAAPKDDSLDNGFRYSFEWTHVWDDLVERVEAEAAPAEGTPALILDELRLDRERFEELRRRAALRRLALEEARRQNVEVDRRALRDESSRHRERHGLLRRQDLAAWLEANGIGEREYEALVRESRLAEAGAALPPEALACHVVAELKWSGEFAGLRRRALEKADALATLGYGEAGTERAGTGRDGVGHLNLVVWYFERRLGERVPEDLDAYARSLGLATRLELYRVIEREYLYSRIRQDDAGGEAAE